MNDASDYALMGFVGLMVALFMCAMLYVAYAMHTENMACIQAGGTMIERACHFDRKERKP